jgi:hypothetical protein
MLQALLRPAGAGSADSADPPALPTNGLRSIHRPCDLRVALPMTRRYAGARSPARALPAQLSSAKPAIVLRSQRIQTDNLSQDERLLP